MQLQICEKAFHFLFALKTEVESSMNYINEHDVYLVSQSIMKFLLKGARSSAR